MSLTITVTDPLACQLQSEAHSRQIPVAQLSFRARSGSAAAEARHPIGSAWTEQVQRLLGHLGPQLVQRQVVEDPERSALRGDDQVVVLDGQIGDRYERQVQLEALPAAALVEGDVHALFRARVEQALPLRVGADDGAWEWGIEVGGTGSSFCAS